MRVLSMALRAMLALIVFASSCSSRGPLSPEEAFGVIQKAYHRGNPELMLTALSEESIRHLTTMSSLIAAMGEKRREKLAERYGVEAERLSSLSPTAYLGLEMRLARAQNDDALGKALDSGILKCEIKDTGAVLTAPNGMELSFVKEGPYWKFDMTDW